MGNGIYAPWIILGPILGVWALLAIALKGYSLWHAAKRNETWWFIALLLINTMGILELIYIGVVLKKFNQFVASAPEQKKEEPVMPSEKTEDKQN